MGVIITMDSKKFLKEFLPSVTDTSGYEFILISEDVKIRNMEDKAKNIMSFPRLIPTPPVINLYVNGEMKSYKKAYLDQIQDPQIEAFISIIVKAAVVNDMKVVLLCSKSESEKKYIDMLSEYIEAAYELKVYSWKKYSEDPKKALTVKNREDIVKILGRKFEKMSQNGVSLNLNVDKDELKKKLKNLGKKELLKLAKDKNIKIKEEIRDDKGEIIKRIIKKIAS